MGSDVVAASSHQCFRLSPVVLWQSPVDVPKAAEVEGKAAADTSLKRRLPLGLARLRCSKVAELAGVKARTGPLSAGGLRDGQVKLKRFAC